MFNMTDQFAHTIVNTLYNWIGWLQKIVNAIFFIYILLIVYLYQRISMHIIENKLPTNYVEQSNVQWIDLDHQQSAER